MLAGCILETVGRSAGKRKLLQQSSLNCKQAKSFDIAASSALAVPRGSMRMSVTFELQWVAANSMTLSRSDYLTGLEPHKKLQAAQDGSRQG